MGGADVRKPTKDARTAPPHQAEGVHAIVDDPSVRARRDKMIRDRSRFPR
jgi:hypothetical protein